MSIGIDLHEAERNLRNTNIDLVITLFLDGDHVANSVLGSL